jgi:hypothetical protein
MTPALNSHIIDGYMAFLENLSPGAKLDIISKLTQSLKSDVRPKENRFERSFGAWVGTETAEELIQDIRNSRTFNRQIEEL